jgi:hypothetical protein
LSTSAYADNAAALFSDSSVKLKSLDDMRKDILVEFLSSATVGVIEWWFTHAMPCSTIEITEQLWALLEINQVIPRSDVPPHKYAR